jgi:GNAT superfamily N-acetyltransferase
VRPAGFATGIETLHPDKEPELCLYEIGVDDAYRRRGIGRALIRAVGDLARELGCSSVYVLTEAGNAAALATYAFGGVEREDGIVSFTWRPPPG